MLTARRNCGLFSWTFQGWIAKRVLSESEDLYPYRLAVAAKHRVDRPIAASMIGASLLGVGQLDLGAVFSGGVAQSMKEPAGLKRVLAARDVIPSPSAPMACDSAWQRQESRCGWWTNRKEEAVSARDRDGCFGWKRRGHEGGFAQTGICHRS